ncbi:Transcription factor [Sarracenia purpurea var. burkii]
MDFQLQNFEDTVEDLRGSNEGSRSSWRQPDLYESPDSSEFSTGSTLLSQTAVDKTEECQGELCAVCQDTLTEIQSTHIGDQICVGDYGNGILSGENTNQDVLTSCGGIKDNDCIYDFSVTEFGSPLQVTPIFRSLAAGIPSPKFSESVSHLTIR